MKTAEEMRAATREAAISFPIDQSIIDAIEQRVSEGIYCCDVEAVSAQEAIALTAMGYSIRRNTRSVTIFW